MAAVQTQPVPTDSLAPSAIRSSPRQETDDDSEYVRIALEDWELHAVGGLWSKRGRGMSTERRRLALHYTYASCDSSATTARHVVDHHCARSQTMILGPAVPTTIRRLHHLTPQITPLRSPSPFRSIFMFAIQPEFYIRFAGKTMLGMRPVAVTAPIQHIFTSLHRSHLPLRVPHVLRAEYSAARLSRRRLQLHEGSVPGASNTPPRRARWRWECCRDAVAAGERRRRRVPPELARHPARPRKSMCASLDFNASRTTRDAHVYSGGAGAQARARGVYAVAFACARMPEPGNGLSGPRVQLGDAKEGGYNEEVGLDAPAVRLSPAASRFLDESIVAPPPIIVIYQLSPRAPHPRFWAERESRRRGQVREPRQLRSASQVFRRRQMSRSRKRPLNLINNRVEKLELAPLAGIRAGYLTTIACILQPAHQLRGAHPAVHRSADYEERQGERARASSSSRQDERDRRFPSRAPNSSHALVQPIELQPPSPPQTKGPTMSRTGKKHGF
ncbi:hypothetical protein BJ912DRAFT_1044816 [Pholiota molesta]|nr:hypothetical protein BJ912DRAFT_1044816 [Pholiota molesta]